MANHTTKTSADGTPSQPTRPCTVLWCFDCWPGADNDGSRLHHSPTALARYYSRHGCAWVGHDDRAGGDMRIVVERYDAAEDGDGATEVFVYAGPISFNLTAARAREVAAGVRRAAETAQWMVDGDPAVSGVAADVTVIYLDSVREVQFGAVDDDGRAVVFMNFVRTPDAVTVRANARSGHDLAYLPDSFDIDGAAFADALERMATIAEPAVKAAAS